MAAPSAPPGRCASPRRRPRRMPSNSGNMPPPSSRRSSPLPPARTRPSVGGAAVYEGAAGELRGAYGRETAAAWGGWSEGVRDRARVAGAPQPGETDVQAMEERVETKTGMTMKGTAREARQTVTKDEAAEGRAGIAAERGKPFEQQATENLPFIGGWLAGQLFGTARNEAPDAAANPPKTDESPGSASGPGGLGSLVAMMAARKPGPGSVPAHQPLVLLGDRHEGVGTCLRRPVDPLVAAVGKPVAVERRPVAGGGSRGGARRRGWTGPSTGPPPSRAGRSPRRRRPGRATRPSRGPRPRSRRARRPARARSAGVPAGLRAFFPCPWPSIIPAPARPAAADARSGARRSPARPPSSFPRRPSGSGGRTVR